MIPGVVSGHVIAHLYNAVFADITVLEALICTKGAQKCCCNGFVAQKLKTLKPNNTSQDA